MIPIICALFAEYMSCAEAAKKWGISQRRVQKPCEENRIPGAASFSRVWLIPKDAEKPVDGRQKEFEKPIDCPLGG